MTEKLVIRPETDKFISELIKRYPVSEAALIPALHRVQDDLGWLSTQAMDWIANRLSIPKVRVYGVVSFYTMFRRSKPGRHRLEICTNLSCSLLGGEHLREYLCNKLGIRPGQTTPDNRITLMEVECLGSCGTAPVMLVDDVFHENLTPESVDRILAKFRSEKDQAGVS